MKQVLSIGNFSGGLSDDEKLGQDFSFSFAQAMDFRRSPSLMRLHRALTKESSTTITTEITDAVRVDQNNGDVYVAGLTKIYKRAVGANGAAGTYSTSTSSTSLVDVRDLDYRPDVDALLLYDRYKIHEFYPLSNSPAYTFDKYKEYASLTQVSSGGSYPLPTSISESALFTFTCTKEPLYSVVLKVNTKGTSADWIVTVHDGANNVIGTSTVLFANLPAAFVEVEFVFTTPLRLKIGTSYHIHATATNTTGIPAIVSTSANTLPLAYVILKATRLVNTGEFGHATMQYGQKSLFCNERYLGEWELLDTSSNATSGYDPHRLIFPAEVVAMKIARWNEYVAIGCAVKRSTDSTNDAPTEGIIFFWDGASVFYSFDLPCPEGAPYGLHSINNVLHWESNGRKYRWAGGDIEMEYEFPGVDEFTATSGAPNTEVYLRAARHSFATRGSLMLMGYPYETANNQVKIGVYSYGRGKGTMPLAFGFDHVISTGNTSVQFDTSTTPDTPVTGITCLKNFGTNLLVAWKDYVSGAITYGVDYLNDTSAAAASGSWESLWFDNQRPDKEKEAYSLVITFKALPSGCTITPKIRYDRETSFTTGTAATAGAIEARMTMHKRFSECMFGFNVTSSSGNFPEIISVSFKFDDLLEEEHDT
ncbi:hypothetical protein [Caudoviricetes sp.]|nr:hypothetical protein [Caudoviricetes sp.]